MKKSLFSPILPAVVLAAVLCAPRGAAAKITARSLADLTVANQGILPNDNYTPYSSVVGLNSTTQGYILIMSLDIASDSGQRLTSISLSQLGAATLDIDSSVIVNRSGTILGVVGGTGTIAIAGGAAVPANNEGGNVGADFFIGIRTTDLCTNGTSGTFQVLAGGVAVAPAAADDVTNVTLTTQAITCELIIADIMPVEYNNATSTGIPEFPLYSQYHPGEMIRPRYDQNPVGYGYSPTPFQHRVPQVVPWETRTAVLAIGCSQRNVTANGSASPSVQTPGESLDSITLTVTDTGKADFDPNRSFRDTTTGRPGVTLWRDVDQNGVWNPAPTGPDTQVTTGYSNGGSWIQKAGMREWTMSVTSAEIIEPTVETGTLRYDYFVVIEQRSDDGYPTRETMGSDYKIWIAPGDVNFGPISDPTRFAGIQQVRVKTLYNNLYLEDVSPERVDPMDLAAAVDPTYNVIPTIGIDIAGGPWANFPNLRLEKIEVKFLDFDNVTPARAFHPLTGDNASGLTLWRDNKASGIVGSFDAADTYVPCTVSAWVDEGIIIDPDFGPVQIYHAVLTTDASSPDTALVPVDDVYTTPTGTAGYYRGDDFFLCVRTNSPLSYGARFRMRIDPAGLWLTAPKVAQNSNPAVTREMKANVFTKVTSLTTPGNVGLPRSSDPVQILKIEMDDNGSGRTPVLEGLTVEFYDRGGFTMSDLASFSPVYPAYDAGTGWYTVTYVNAAALTQCGVVVYREGATGYIDYSNPVFISRYRPMTYPGVPNGYQFVFQTPQSIPRTLYVAIRTSASFTPGDSFDAGIVGWGLTGLQWETWASRAVPVTDALSVQSTTYVRQATGTFNPIPTGQIILHLEERYDYLKLTWQNLSPVTSDAFVRYEIVRDGVVIDNVYTFGSTTYYNRRTDANPPVEGVTHQYIVRMVYMQGGEQRTLSSNVESGKILGFYDDSYGNNSMNPGDVKAVPGHTSVTITWTDNSYDPNDASTYPFKADDFIIRRYNLDDGTEWETTISAHAEYANIWYEYTDTGCEEGTNYKYEIIARRNVPGGTVESQASAVFTETIPPEGDPPAGGGGGCFIATAAFGTPMAGEISVLKAFRDRQLAQSPGGRAFIRFYYRHSPPVAAFIAEKPALRAAVRAWLKPLVWMLQRTP